MLKLRAPVFIEPRGLRAPYPVIHMIYGARGETIPQVIWIGGFMPESSLAILAERNRDEAGYE